VWTSAECAAAWGVRPGTWLSYVSRGQAPAPLPDRDERGCRLWAAGEVRDFPRPGPGHSRAGAGPEAAQLLARMREAAARIEQLRAEQRALLVAGRREGLEILPMARALGISRQTAYSWLDDA
jgi:DNA-directed RNA polymerase specialized sigma24 family protein